jgi:hypothetical protein
MIDLALHTGHLTPFGREFFAELVEHYEWENGLLRGSNRIPRIAGGSGTFSNWFQTTVLGHGTGQDNASWANLSPVFLALCTIVPDSSKTGSTITEANYTGYARASLANTVWGSPVAGGAGGQSTVSNASVITYANCTAGSSTVIGWALCTAVTAGNAICWGTAASVVISTTQTPATVAANGLTIGLT